MARRVSLCRRRGAAPVSGPRAADPGRARRVGARVFAPLKIESVKSNHEPTCHRHRRARCADRRARVDVRYSEPALRRAPRICGLSDRDALTARTACPGASGVADSNAHGQRERQRGYRSAGRRDLSFGPSARGSNISLHVPCAFPCWVGMHSVYLKRVGQSPPAMRFSVGGKDGGKQQKTGRMARIS